MKRLFDLVFTGGLLIFVWPLILLIALIVRNKMGSPIFFRQERPGLHGTPFILLKFRTMLDVTDSSGNPLSDNERLTRLGRFLRESSLDELPQLFNMLKGELSVIGPRPLLMEYLPLYNAEQARRHNVKPGLTGWAQVNGRNSICWKEKFELDVWYVDHHSFALDLKILWLTGVKVFKRDGIAADGHVTMPKFTGNNKEEDE